MNNVSNSQHALMYWGGKSKIMVPCTFDMTNYKSFDDVNFKIQLIQFEDRQCFLK